MNATKKRMMEEIREVAVDKALEIKYGVGKNERRVSVFFEDLDKASDFIHELRTKSQFLVNRRGFPNNKLSLSIDVIIGDTKNALSAREVFLRMRSNCSNFIREGLFCQFRVPGEEDSTIRHCVMGLCPLINTVDTVLLSTKGE
jgi:hypothetical protein